MKIVVDCQHPENVHPVFMSLQILTGIRAKLDVDSSTGGLCAALGTRYLQIFNITEEQKQLLRMAMDLVARQLNIKLVDVTGFEGEQLPEDAPEIS
jgi:hypothetical protein